MRVCIFGGAGFIGSHLVRRLLNDGHKVVVVDDMTTGDEDNLPEHENLVVKRISILEIDMSEYMDFGFDVGYHLAALTRPAESMMDAWSYHQTNVNGTYNVLEHCCQLEPRTLVFASSATVYGEGERYPTDETCRTEPMNPYGYTKLIGERYCEMYSHLYGMNIASLRLFNVYGERMNPDGEYASLIPKFIKQVKNGETPTIYGTGEQRRDFIHVDDVVEAFIRATGMVGVYNVGSGENYSVNEIFEIIRNNIGADIKPRYETMKSPEPTQTLSNSAKLRIATDWQPTISLEEGIKRLL